MEELQVVSSSERKAQASISGSYFPFVRPSVCVYLL